MKENWTYKKLGEVCEVLDSKRKPITKSDRQVGNIPYYGATGIQDYVKDFIFDGRFLLVGEDGAKWGKDENTAYIIEGKSWVNNHAHILKFHDSVMDTFVRYYLNGKDLTSYITGAVVQKLTQAALISIPIPVPPLLEQQRIVSELDLLQSIINKQQAQLKELDKLAQAVFYDMFGDPVENEKGWEVKKYSTFASVIGGYAFKSELFVPSGIPVLKIGNINTGRLRLEGVCFYPYTSELIKYEVHPGDLVISLTGTTGKEDYGNVCYIPNDYNLYYLNQRNAILKPFLQCNIRFLQYVFEHNKIKKELTKNCHGIRQANILNKDILNLSIPFPPLPLQHSFATKIESIEKQKSAISQSIAETQKLFDYTMDKYFG